MSIKTVVLNPFSIDSDAHSDAHALVVPVDELSLTKQSDAQSADINFIVKQFGVTQALPYGIAVPEYADYSDVPNDYHAAMNFISDSQDAFMQMPAALRSRFENDAGLFVEFFNDPANVDEARSLGLLPAGVSEPAKDLPAGSEIPADKP